MDSIYRIGVGQNRTTVHSVQSYLLLSILSSPCGHGGQGDIHIPPCPVQLSAGHFVQPSGQLSNAKIISISTLPTTWNWTLLYIMSNTDKEKGGEKAHVMSTSVHQLNKTTTPPDWSRPISLYLAGAGSPPFRGEKIRRNPHNSSET